MAIAYVGSSGLIALGSSSGSQSITVPSCSCAVLFRAGAHDGSDTMYDSGGASFTLGGSPVTWLGRSPSGDNMDSAAYALVNPPSGSQTLGWSGVTESGCPPVIVILYYDGVDTSSPVVDVDGVSGASSITGLTTPTGSMSVVCAASYNGSVDLSDGAQTVRASGYSGPTVMGVAEKAEASTLIMGAGASWPSMVAVVLKVGSSPLSAESPAAMMMGL